MPLLLVEKYLLCRLEKNVKAVSLFFPSDENSEFAPDPENTKFKSRLFLYFELMQKNICLNLN